MESEMVLTSEDFYNVTTEENLMKDLYSVLRNNTCVFIGFGMEDRDLLDLLFNIRAKNQNFGAMKHYLVIPEGRIDKERVKYLNKKFGIEQIALDRDDFLERLIEEFKKKVAMID
nr:SIR2 family protein [Tumebacillus avium]